MQEKFELKIGIWIGSKNLPVSTVDSEELRDVMRHVNPQV